MKKYEIFKGADGRLRAWSEGTAARRTAPFLHPVERLAANGCIYIYDDPEKSGFGGAPNPHYRADIERFFYNIARKS